MILKMKELIHKIIKFDKYSFEEIFSLKGYDYTFLNPVSYLQARQNQDLYSNFDGFFADGSILVFFTALFYNKKVKRRSFDMTSIAPPLFDFVCKNNKSIYFLGSKEEELNKTITIFRDRYPDMKIAGFRNGYFSSEAEKENTIKDILKVSPDFLVVGMGAIYQEKFLNKVRKSGFKGIGFTCGGFIHQTSLDKLNYYPNWVNKYNLRFLFRMHKEKHTRSRYLYSALVFPFLFIWDRFFLDRQKVNHSMAPK